jgi:cytochrome c
MSRLNKFQFAVLVGVLAASGTQPSSAQEYMGMPDIGAGRAAFRINCASCHSLEAGKVEKGPSLNGVYGRRIASEGNFAYSEPLRRMNDTWTESTLTTYLRDPFDMGTDVNMIIHGIKDDRMSADLIGFLKHEAK